MAATQPYPKTERVTSNVSSATMFTQAARPFFLLLFVCMWMTAATELGPDQWFPSVMKQVAGIEGIWFLMLTAGIMFVLRFFVSSWVHRFSPFAVMTVCSVITAIGLYWLGSLQPGTSIPIAFLAATVFGFGKVYYWPTMLGVTAERFPKGGALLMSLMGGAGFLSISFVLPLMGAQFDKLGPGAALRSVAVLPVILTVAFGAMYVALSLEGRLPRARHRGRCARRRRHAHADVGRRDRCGRLESGAPRLVGVQARCMLQPEVRMARDATDGQGRTVAIVGLGQMGRAMAQRLAEAGFRLRVWNRTRSRAEGCRAPRCAKRPRRLRTAPIWS